jgi:4-aminobutyrate aminotransferase-like enzyme
LEEPETDLLFDLVAARFLQSVVIAAWRSRLHPDNLEYIGSHAELAWAALQRLDALDRTSVTDSVRRACGMPATRTDRVLDVETVVAHRRRRMGPGLRLSYEPPLRLAASDGVWLVDTGGIRYLDAYNNVPHVGHGRREVVAAIARQSAVLNTNTRYLVDGVLEYADRVAGLLPEDLSVVVFANSGSEANDLAWRMARTVTGRQGIIVTEHAYHGATALTMATSPEEVGVENLEPWVATVPAPGCSGVQVAGGRDVEQGSAGHLEAAVERLAAAGVAPAAFACDTAFSSDGIFDVPPGYLHAIYATARAAGALCIADEVQAGLGRVGSRLWGFAGDDVVPDIVTLGKPMGNGHPLAAVVTTPEIAAAFAERGYYFSTFAGNPVSAAAGMAVLDVMEAEGLPERAEGVGEYLRSRLRELAENATIIGEIRGPGLFVGVEMIEGAGRPDPARATAVVNEMRHRRVLIGRTGRSGNVLKIRPPLVFGEDHADLLVENLAVVLTEAVGGVDRRLGPPAG